MRMEPIVRYGIKSRFDSFCALCGAPTAVGDRIYKLPEKRGGRKWVCAACRWEDDERVVDLAFVLRKVAHRMGVGPYTPKLVELEVILAAVRGVVMKTDDEVLLFNHFDECFELRRSPTLGRAKMATLLGVLRRAQE